MPYLRYNLQLHSIVNLCTLPLQAQGMKMFSRQWVRFLLVASLLLVTVSSYKRDVARNRGFTPRALRDMEAKALYARNTPPAQRLYYTNATESESMQLVSFSESSAWYSHTETRILCRVAARDPYQLHDRDVLRRYSTEYVGRQPWHVLRIPTPCWPAG